MKKKKEKKKMEKFLFNLACYDDYQKGITLLRKTFIEHGYPKINAMFMQSTVIFILSKMLANYHCCERFWTNSISKCQGSPQALETWLYNIVYVDQYYFPIIRQHWFGFDWKESKEGYDFWSNVIEKVIIESILFHERKKYREETARGTISRL